MHESSKFETGNPMSGTATKTFATWLTKSRTKAGLSYKQLAEKADVSVATVHGIEHGVSSPSLDTLEKLTSALGTSVEASLRVRKSGTDGKAGSARDATVVQIKQE